MLISQLVLASTLSPIALDEASPRSHADKTSPPSTSLQKQPSGQKMISVEEVMKHKTREDCWVIIEVGTPFIFFSSGRSGGRRRVERLIGC